MLQAPGQWAVHCFIYADTSQVPNFLHLVGECLWKMWIVAKKPGEEINGVNSTAGNGIKILYNSQYFPPEITEVHAGRVKVSITISFFSKNIQETLVKFSGFHSGK
jgi:hypothetical protein